MAEKKRCPHCGALNPEFAEWCNQCLERFAVPEPEPAPEPEPEPEPELAEPHIGGAPESHGEAVRTDEAPGTPGARPNDDVPDLVFAPAARPDGAGAATDGAPGRLPPGTPATQTGAWRISESGISWICSVCEHENPMAALTCEVCGTTFARAINPVEAKPIEGDPGTAALVSLFFPGAGHAYLKLWPQAAARAILSLWVIAVVILAVIANGAGSTLVAVTFGLAAFALWIIAAHDAYREARSEPQLALLRGRMFVYVVLGLLALLFVMLVTAVLGARS